VCEILRTFDINSLYTVYIVMATLSAAVLRILLPTHQMLFCLNAG